MNQNSNFPKFGQQGSQQYGLSSFDVPPTRKGFVAGFLGSALGRKISSPIFATGALLLCGVAFAGIMLSAYNDEASDVPVVKAETLAYKEIPADPGGMAIPNRGSAVFSAINGQVSDEAAPIENLLADDDAPVDRLAAFARQVEETMDEDKKTVGEVVDDVSTLAQSSVEEASETAPVTLQKIENGAASRVQEPKVAGVAPVPEAKPEAHKPVIAHKAGENPETLEFVKSVLEKKDGRIASASDAAKTAAKAAAVQPAAGNATRSFSITPGQYFVQLGSVKSLDGAEGEWGKLRKTFSAELGSLPHRVKSADLGERGTFYRIQAGPMSKASASDICDSIKSQKPGGCLVTQ